MSEPLDFQWEEEEKPRRSTRKAGVVLLGIFLVIVLIAGGGLLWGLSKLNSIEKFANPADEISKIEQSEGIERPTHDPNDENAPVNFLVLGSDSRISAGDPNQWAAGAQRTDAMMLVQVSRERQSVNVMSIPRDSWVHIPGHGMNKVNAAFSFGGPALAIATVEQLTGVPIDHMAVVDFTSFVQLTDAVGGVEIATNSGTKTFTGEEALAFVRERKSLANGDLDRVRRQQAWMLAVMSKVMTRETLSSPTKVLELFDSVSPYVAVDESLSSTDIVSLAGDIKDVRAKDINLMTAPVAGLGRSDDGQSIVNLDEAAFKELADAFARDDVNNYLALNPDVQTIRDGNIR